MRSYYQPKINRLYIVCRIYRSLMSKCWLDRDKYNIYKARLNHNLSLIEAEEVKERQSQ